MPTSENQTPSTSRRRRNKLETIGDVKKTLAVILRALKKSDAPSKEELEKVRVLIYGLSKLAGIMQASDIEERIARLEGRSAGEERAAH